MVQYGKTEEKTDHDGTMKKGLRLGELEVSPNVCVCVCVYVHVLSRVQLFVTPWTVAHRAPLSMELSRQEYWGGLPFPAPGNLPGHKIGLVLNRTAPIGAFSRGQQHQVQEDLASPSSGGPKMPRRGGRGLGMLSRTDMWPEPQGQRRHLWPCLQRSPGAVG